MKIKYLLSVFLVLALTACAVPDRLHQLTDQARTEMETVPFTISVPERKVVNAREIPYDIQAVTTSIVHRLGRTPHPFRNVTFAPGGSQVTPEPAFHYRGFQVTAVDLHWHDVRQTDRNSVMASLEGVLHFLDAVGRQTSVFFAAQYELDSRNIVIHSSQAVMVPPAFPRAQAFIIDANEFRNIVNSNPDFGELYLRVVARAHSRIATLEERERRRQLEQMTLRDRLVAGGGYTGIPTDYVIIVFVMDRITGDSVLDVVVSRTMFDRDSLARPLYRDFDGWRIAYVGGNFDINLETNTFYTKAYYRPPRGVLPDGHERVLIGVFSSEKDYGDSPTRVQTASAAQAEPAGPISSGRVILDTGDRNDATAIQSRLAQLGFYRMTVDGIWGPGSRGALENFQRSSGMHPTGRWDLQTQMKLFEGTGR